MSPVVATSKRPTVYSLRQQAQLAERIHWRLDQKEGTGATSAAWRLQAAFDGAHPGRAAAGRPHACSCPECPRSSR
eukprot:scaffold1290_cov367-Prasinococcus_capsulatus_cf.AAC.7